MSNRWMLTAWMLGAAGMAQAQTTVTVLDSAATVSGPSLATGSDGMGLIAYVDRSSATLKVAHCSNTACTAATIRTIDSVGSVGAGQPTAVTIGADGLPIIVYLTQMLSRVAHCTDAACTGAVLTTLSILAAPPTTDVAIGSDGLPLIVFAGESSAASVVHCSVADCTTHTTAILTPPAPPDRAAVAIGADGLGRIALSRSRTASGPSDPAMPMVYRCLDLACSTFEPTAPFETELRGAPLLPTPVVIATPHAMTRPADGRLLIASTYEVTIVGPRLMRLERCVDVACTSLESVIAVNGAKPPDVALQPNGFPWFAYDDSAGRVRLRACADAACTSSTETCFVASNVVYPLSLGRASDGRSLVAFQAAPSGIGIAHDVSDSCAPPQVSVGDAATTEALGAQARFTATLSAVSPSDVTVAYTTADGTAVAGEDYVVTSGTLTIPGGTTSVDVLVPVIDDHVIEPTETFVVDLSLPAGATLGDAHGVATIVDGMPAVLSAGHCQQVEGNTGAQGCVLPVSLEPAIPVTVTVNFSTADGTAQAGVDYLATSGTLTFTPGTATQTVSVSVIGDTLVELDETFFVNLSNPVNATIGDGQGEALIVDDDAPSLSSLELTHGSRIDADLAAVGPVADQDVYRLAQGPYSSWEIVIDEVSGDAAPGLQVERLAEDNATVLQGGSVVGTGPARVLRWQMRSAVTETRQHIRVGSASCGTTCGPDDTYRLRVYETTGRIPRFNNTATQITVLILQNASSRSVGATVDFWTTGGVLRASVPVPLDPRGTAVLNTSTNPALNGIAGSITVTHDGGYGALAGKAVALEPATGFSFDSPMASKPR